ncbi:hypothetical protein CISIN_1g045259mg [Citrus sinensis]|uniref:Uncharacterized protein n=2 Tax=Citrus TaxID=2706 RepID=A0A067DK68_CITSI|nr:hypothetical protein CISIN_1g045259mg [Citrus sinensis]
MEEIINVGKLGEEMMSNLEPLTKFQVLYLKKLPNLNRVHWKALPFPDACRIFVFKCPELKKLPLDLEREAKVKFLSRERKIGGNNFNGRIK